jgi:signal transduction histidine kinase
MEAGMNDSDQHNIILLKIYAALPDGILVVDDKKVIVSINRQFLDIWRIPNNILHGIEPGSAVALDDVPILSTVLSRVKDPEAFLELVKKLYANPQMNNVCEIELLDGRTVERHSTVLNNNEGLYLGRVWIFRDITQRKLAEHELRKLNGKLQETVAALRDTQKQLVQAEKMSSLGSLVAGISHEINTPIGIGMTSATMLEESLQFLKANLEAGTLKRSSLEDFIAHSAQACDILVNNLRRAADLVKSFKQVAVDQASNEWRTINLKEYLDEILLSLQPQWKHRPIKVNYECDPALSLYTNPGAIYQITSNLINNSLIHAYEPSDQGTIELRATCRDRMVHLDYHDDGKGIPDEFQNRVFDPFFTTRRGSGGSGLGLNIVYNLVTGVLNGKIDLKSVHANGCSFFVTFPLIQEGESTAPTLQSAKQGFVLNFEI